MSNPNHDEHGKFASHAQERANETGQKHHVISRPGLPGLTVLNDGQVSMMKLKKYVVSTHKPPKQEKSKEKTDIQTKIANQYFNDVKKRGF